MSISSIVRCLPVILLGALGVFPSLPTCSSRAFSPGEGYPGFPSAAEVISPPKESPDRPNFLFLFADDQRADTIAAWGNRHIQTPNLDRLVNRGFSFRSNYNLGANGGAVCVPSRAMVNSGLAYFRIPDDLSGVRTLGERLREAGYTTFATGKWHNERASWLRSFDLGRAVFFGGMSDHTKVPVVDLGENGQFENERMGGKFSTELFADAAIDFLDRYTEEDPFFMYVAFTVPHDPRQPPRPFGNFYYDHRPPVPENFMPQHPFNLGEWLTVRDENLAPWPRTEDVIREQLAEYYGMISGLDHQIGRILEKLEAVGRAENTVIVFSADHGLALGSHGLLGKQSLYEHSQKSPLIFAGAGIPNGSTTALSYLLDIPATVLSLSGTVPPPELDGKDLSTIWSGVQPKVRDSLFLAFAKEIRAVRDDRYKLIRYPQIDLLQLFDLQNDPNELENLAADPSHRERVQQMMALLGKWQNQLGDAQPLEVEAVQPRDIDLTGRPRTPDNWQPRWIVDKYF
jgi:arylsulfatase A-like enzyme